MIVLLRIENNEPTGWIVATDTHDARRQAQAAGQPSWLIEALHRAEFPAPGKHALGDNCWMLVL